MQPEDEIHTLVDWLQQGRKVVLATVTATWGSSPRPVGSHMLIDADGNFAGSVSGGCIEAAVVMEALDALVDHASRRLSFGVSDQEAWSVGLSCGGAIEVLLQPLSEADAQVITELQRCQQQRRPAVLVVAERGLQLIDGSEQKGRAHDKSAWLNEQQFARVYRPAFVLCVVGAGHIAQFLVPMAQLAGYQVTLIDPRAAFISEQRFSGVNCEHAWPDESMALQQLDRQSAVVCLTHDPKIDDPALQLALASEALYVGALGSRNTHAKRVARLSEQGLAEQVHRIHGPVGLALGGRAPAEIAIAILAQLTQVRYAQGAQS